LTLPNLVTASRIAAIPLFVAFLLLPGYQNRLIATAIFSVLVATDALDGYLARRLNAVTDFGKYLDPLADKILVITALLLSALKRQEKGS
jgi:CDP-diacylglycerol--glycerol-3-phosphate 3-phosphatidyltransferase